MLIKTINEKSCTFLKIVIRLVEIKYVLDFGMTQDFFLVSFKHIHVAFEKCKTRAFRTGLKSHNVALIAV